MSPPQTTIAAFDFDGTLTRGDSLLPFLKHYSGIIKYSIGMLKMSPVLGCYAVGLMKNDIAKTKLLTHFLGGASIAEIEESGKVFAEQKLVKLENDKAMNRLRWHQNQGHQCVLVSASLVHYLEPWAQKAGFDHVIASSLKVDGHGKVSGDLDGGNCFGENKALRIREYLSNKQDVVIYAYGDSRGDKEMLELADYAYYKTMPED